jgi:hypothetical protein
MNKKYLIKNRVSITRDFLRRWYNVGRTKTFVKMSAEPMATHLPVLIGMARLRPVRRVLEFGSGRFSTLAFLNRSAFPELEVLQSYENDATWYETVKQMVRADPRVTLTHVDGLMHRVVDAKAVQDYDLVFIDDSFNSRQRSDTIRAIIAAQPKLAAVHDFETFAYRRATNSSRRRYRFSALLPNTGIVWNDDHFTIERLKALNGFIAEHTRQLAPEDLQGWAQVMDK